MAQAVTAVWPKTECLFAAVATVKSAPENEFLDLLVNWIEP